MKFTKCWRRPPAVWTIWVVGRPPALRRLRQHNCPAVVLLMMMMNDDDDDDDVEEKAGEDHDDADDEVDDEDGSTGDDGGGVGGGVGVMSYLIIVTDATDAVSVNFSGRCKFLLI